jgi:hypothetical protein
MVVVDECCIPYGKAIPAARPDIGRALSWFSSFRFQAKHADYKARNRLFIVKKAFKIQLNNSYALNKKNS